MFRERCPQPSEILSAHLFLRNQFLVEILRLQRILLLRAVDKNVPLGDKGVVSEQTMQRKETHARGHKGESFGVDAETMIHYAEVE